MSAVTCWCLWAFTTVISWSSLGQTGVSFIGHKFSLKDIKWYFEPCEPNIATLSRRHFFGVGNVGILEDLNLQVWGRICDPGFSVERVIQDAHMTPIMVHEISTSCRTLLRSHSIFILTVSVYQLTALRSTNSRQPAPTKSVCTPTFSIFQGARTSR